MVGVYDKQRGYRFYRTIRKFLECELTRKNTKYRFYAHFGGSADIIYILQEVLKNVPELMANAIFAGSSAVIVRLNRDERTSWTFVDSGFLIRRPLADIGEWIGLAKGDKANIYTQNFEELREYNERDCVILYNAIERLQGQVNELGGNLKATLASSALDLFRRRFLRRTIPTKASINSLARQSYIASRVEVFRRECPLGEYYDINSSFPTSMTHPQPGELSHVSKKISDKEESCYLADATVEIDSSSYLPPLARRTDDHRIVFPTGRWRGIFDSADIRLLESSGQGTIQQIHEVTHFRPFSDLAAYIHTLYDLRVKSTGYEKEVFKLFLNALYGKFGERSDKRRIVIRPRYTTCEHNPECPEDEPCITMIAPDIYAIKEDKDIPHAHVPISSHITALSRGLLFESLSKCRQIYYCDTDSVVCGANDSLPTGPRLGELKHEYTVRDGLFLAPKLYSFEKGDTGARVVRAKGFSRLDYEGFCRLAEGKDFTLKRMARIRESLGTDSTITPRDIEVKKRIHLKNTKRCFLPNGDSRPWHVSELEAS